MGKFLYEKRWKWTTSKAGKHMNELQTINDVIRRFVGMRPVKSLKLDASFNVVVQKFDSVEDLTLRLSAT